MADHQRDTQESGISVGDISGTGIVVGHGSSAHVSFDPQISDVQRKIIEQLAELLRQLGTDSTLARNPEEARELATEARAEVKKAVPRWGIVRTLINGVAGTLTAGSALTQIITNIEQLIPHAGH